MSASDKTKGVVRALKLDSHHAMERFGIMFTVLSTVLVALLVSTGFSAVNNNRQAMDSKVIFTSEFMTSRTQLQGSVPGVYVSPDKTRALVMMHFRDSTKISTLADNYQAFMTGSSMNLTQEPLRGEMTGQIIVFGSTGFMGMVIDSDRPFEQQILSLTMRANSELVYSRGDTRVRTDLRNDESFLTNDQWRLYINPGASGAPVAESLAGRTLNPSAIFYELVTKPQEAEVRTQLDDTLGLMRASLLRIDEFEAALGRTPSVDGDFLVNPRVPTPQEQLRPISGDVVTGEPASLVAGEESESTLALETDWVGPDGFDFDWRNGSIQEGYLDDLVPEGQRYGDWMAAKLAAGRSSGEDSPTRFNSTKIEWTMTDGSLLKDHESAGTPGMTDVLTLRTNLASAYDEYWELKQTYLVTLPVELLNMELQLRSLEQSVSVNSTDKALLTY